MRGVFEILLGQYRDHVLLGNYLTADEPDFAALAASDVPMMVSSSELLMLHVALAFHNGDRTARIADIHALDHDNRVRVMDAINLSMHNRV